MYTVLGRMKVVIRRHRIDACPNPSRRFIGSSRNCCAWQSAGLGASRGIQEKGIMKEALARSVGDAMGFFGLIQPSIDGSSSGFEINVRERFRAFRKVRSGREKNGQPLKNGVMVGPLKYRVKRFLL